MRVYFRGTVRKHQVDTRNSCDERTVYEVDYVNWKDVSIWVLTSAVPAHAVPPAPAAPSAPVAEVHILDSEDPPPRYKPIFLPSRKHKSKSTSKNKPDREREQITTTAPAAEVLPTTRRREEIDVPLCQAALTN